MRAFALLLSFAVGCVDRLPLDPPPDLGAKALLVEIHSSTGDLPSEVYASDVRGDLVAALPPFGGARDELDIFVVQLSCRLSAYGIIPGVTAIDADDDSAASFSPAKHFVTGAHRGHLSKGSAVLWTELPELPAGIRGLLAGARERWLSGESCGFQQQTIDVEPRFGTLRFGIPLGDEELLIGTNATLLRVRRDSVVELAPKPSPPIFSAGFRRADGEVWFVTEEGRVAHGTPGQEIIFADTATLARPSAAATILAGPAAGPVALYRTVRPATEQIGVVLTFVDFYTEENGWCALGEVPPRVSPQDPVPPVNRASVVFSEQSRELLSFVDGTRLHHIYRFDHPPATCTPIFEELTYPGLSTSLAAFRADPELDVVLATDSGNFYRYDGSTALADNGWSIDPGGDLKDFELRDGQVFLTDSSPGARLLEPPASDYVCAALGSSNTNVGPFGGGYFVLDRPGTIHLFVPRDPPRCDE